jgi:hypothetical protein
MSDSQSSTPRRRRSARKWPSCGRLPRTESPLDDGREVQVLRDEPRQGTAHGGSRGVVSGTGKHLARDRARNDDLAPRVGEHVEPSDLRQGDEWRCDRPIFRSRASGSTPATTSSSVSWKGDTPYPPRASMNSARESPAISAARPWLIRPSSYHFTAAATRSSRVNVVGSCRTLASAPSGRSKAMWTMTTCSPREHAPARCTIFARRRPHVPRSDPEGSSTHRVHPPRPVSPPVHSGPFLSTRPSDPMLRNPA